MSIIKTIIEDRDIDAGNPVSLDDTQLGALLRIKKSPTDQMAYNQVSGALNVVSARDMLHVAGYIHVNAESKAAVLTQRGEDAINAYNLIEDGSDDELTEKGQEIIDKFDKVKNKWKHLVSFKHGA